MEMGGAECEQSQPEGVIRQVRVRLRHASVLAKINY